MEDLSQVLELVLPYIDTREMHCRASLVSQHISSCMQAHIRQQIAAFLQRYLWYFTGWLADTRPDGRDAQRRFIRWLCRFAGAEAMGSPAAAGAVLAQGYFSYEEDVIQELVQSGLRLTDACVVAAARQREHVTQVAASLLAATPPERAEQHSGLSPLMRFVCTAKPTDPVPEEVLAATLRMPAEQIAGVLQVQANRRSQHPLLFRALLQLLVKHMPPYASRGRELCELLRTVLFKSGWSPQDPGVKCLVDALGGLPTGEQPDPATCCQLLRLAIESCTDAIPLLAALPGVRSLPQDVYCGLLGTNTNMDCSFDLAALHQLLQLPHARHLTSGQLCQLLLNCMEPGVDVSKAASTLLSLPVAESLSSEQALQLLKAAASHDAQQLASQYNYHSDSEPKLVFDAYAPLGDWLTEAAAVELFRHVIHYRWYQLVPTLMTSTLLMWQLGPDGMAAVVRHLVTSGMWLNEHNAGYNKQQLQDKLLQLDAMQDMTADAAYAVMHVLAEQGYSFTEVLRNVDGGRYISCDQVATLLQLAMDNGEPVDVSNLARGCSAAAKLNTALLLQLVQQLVDSWPVPGQRLQHNLWQQACEHLHCRPSALAALLQLPAAHDFTPQDCLALATAAAKAGLDAFRELCQGLPQLQEASRGLPVALLLRMYRQAVEEGDDNAVAQLVALTASQQLEPRHVQPLLLQAFAKATRVRSSWDRDRVWTKDDEQQLLAADVLRQRDRVIGSLLVLQTNHAFSPDALTELVQSCIAHGLQKPAAALLEQQAKLEPQQLEQLLLTCLTQQAQHVRQSKDDMQEGMLQLLLQQPGAARLDTGAVGRLLVARGAFVACCKRGTRQHLYQQWAADDKGFDPAEVLLQQLPSVHAAQQSETADLANLLAAAVQGGVRSEVFEGLWRAPAAAGLDTVQLRQLLWVCAQNHNAGAFELLLQHPAAPGRDDSQVALYASMMKKS